MLMLFGITYYTFRAAICQTVVVCLLLVVLIVNREIGLGCVFCSSIEKLCPDGNYLIFSSYHIPIVIDRLGSNLVF